MFKKRTKEAAFVTSQEENPEAKRAAIEDFPCELVTTSSPIKEVKQSKTPLEDSMDAITISPLSRVQILDKPGVTSKEKPQSKKAPKISREQRSDGQHIPADNCGCHTCVLKLAIIKNEIIKPDRKFSRRFLDQVKKLKIHLHTSLTSHPKDCICKMHTEKINCKTKPTPPKAQPQEERTSVVVNKVSNLRSHFEERDGSEKRMDPRTGRRPDPRTGHPPISSREITSFPPNSYEDKRKESSTSQSSIPVLTSR